VDVDNVQAAFRMTEYLLQLGHQRIAFVHEKQESAFAFVRERQEGYRQAMACRGRYLPALSGLSCRQILSPTRPVAPRPTALFCAYDALALSLIRELQHRDVRVPEEISVVGFDDIPSVSMGLPGLTTIRQPMTRIGELATEMLLELIEGAAEPGRQVILPTELVLRQSAAPPRA
jgi:DNA-binding LacI/PurR family transcriptional regulator